MILTTILFFVGFYILMKGADLLVDGSTSIAKNFQISDLIIGLTVVSFGTSAPELIINIFASFSGSSDIAIGNVFGSNVANILLILGIAAIFSELPVSRGTVLSEIPFTLIAIFLVGFLANSDIFVENKHLLISRIDGIILLLFFTLFMAYIYKIARESRELIGDFEVHVPVKKAYLYVFIGMIGLFFGGKWVVDGAVEFASAIGMSESFLGLTIVSIGTSLPELATSINAAKKKKSDIAVGNIVGSNIFNLLWILGLSAVIKPLPFLEVNNQDVMVVAIASMVLILSMSIGKKYVISRSDGFIYILLYFAYMVLLYYRG